jgi:hypothetical protein
MIGIFNKISFNSHKDLILRLSNIPIFIVYPSNSDVQPNKQFIVNN